MKNTARTSQYTNDIAKPRALNMAPSSVVSLGGDNSPDADPTKLAEDLRKLGYSEDYVASVCGAMTEKGSVKEWFKTQQEEWKESLTKRDIIYHSSAFGTSTSGLPMLYAYGLIERGERFKLFADSFWPDSELQRQELITTMVATRRQREEAEYRARKEMEREAAERQAAKREEEEQETRIHETIEGKGNGKEEEGEVVIVLQDMNGSSGSSRSAGVGVR
ncbi:hypothetical protein HDU93_007693 [Gonapodya sp. JEL0774]|nr:hypothetical protein HDU93_007693 [Gonapodya sp. JEL0774]